MAPRGFEPLIENRQALANKALTENQNPVLDKTLQKQANFDTSGLILPPICYDIKIVSLLIRQNI